MDRQEAEDTLRALGRRMTRRRRLAAEDMAAAREFVPQASEAGVPQVRIAELLGVDRQTVRDMLGIRRRTAANKDGA